MSRKYRCCRECSAFGALVQQPVRACVRACVGVQQHNRQKKRQDSRTSTSSFLFTHCFFLVWVAYCLPAVVLISFGWRPLKGTLQFWLASKVFIVPAAAPPRLRPRRPLPPLPSPPSSFPPSVDPSDPPSLCAPPAFLASLLPSLVPLSARFYFLDKKRSIKSIHQNTSALSLNKNDRC